MLLTIKERFLILSILPSEGNIVTLKIVRDLRDNLGFSEKELKDLGIEQHPEMGNVTWDNAHDSDTFEIPIGEKAKDVIVDALQKASDTNKLSVDHIPLYERFVEGKDDASQLRSVSG